MASQPRQSAIARDQWARYCYLRDGGHRSFVQKASRCDDFVTGYQWAEDVVNELKAAKRPALTINKVLITISSILGEQIDLRAETIFRPKFGAPPNNAETLTKLFRHISDDNQMNWVRSEVFADGVVTSRGFYDCRLSFKKNVAGDVMIKRLNPKAVMIDDQASEYDPDEWNDVVVTHWATPNDIKMIYGKTNIANKLATRGHSMWDRYGYDSMDVATDTFGGLYSNYVNSDETDELARAVNRSIRVIDRQHKVLVRMKFFVDPKTGDKMRVPEGWDDEMVNMTAKAGGLLVVEDVGKRIRWTVTAEEFVLHDEWSPFERFTIVPFFPSLRNGRTTGIVETLIDPQELLNKTLSQELHIVNTMANSGWKVRANTLRNMTIDELEEQGAKTGLVLEIDGDPTKDVEKIQPNQIPQGLDRLSFKAENFIKTVSGRGDSQLGLDRADVSGKAINEKKDSSQVNLRVALDNLERTDWLLARHILDIIQHYYTDQRIVNVTVPGYEDQVEEVSINMPDPNSGEILNDLTLGTYAIVISSQNARRTLEETEFQQAVGLRELGIAIPDRFMLKNSNLRDREKIIADMDAEAQSPAGQARAEAQALQPQLQVAQARADITKAESEAVKNRTKAVKDLADSQPDGDEQSKLDLEQQKFEQEMKMRWAEHEQKMQIQREEAALKLKLQEAEAYEKRRTMRIQAATAAAQAMQQPAAGAKPEKGAKA